MGETPSSGSIASAYASSTLESKPSRSVSIAQSKAPWGTATNDLIEPSATFPSWITRMSSPLRRDMPSGCFIAKNRKAGVSSASDSGAFVRSEKTSRAGSPSSVCTVPPVLLVTTMGSPSLRHPCATPTPMGPSEPIAAATTAPLSTRTPSASAKNWKVFSYR